MDKYVFEYLSGLKSYADFEEILDLIPDIMIYIKDKDCRWITCNNACLRLLNFNNKKEVYGITEYDIFPKKIAEAIHLDDLDVIEGRKRIIGRTELIVSETGHLVWVSTNKLPLIGQDANVAGLVGTTRILTRSDKLPDDYQQFRPVIDHIQANLDRKIDIKELARISFLSNSQFRKRFRKHFRLSPRDFILRARLQAASKLLISTDLAIINVALNCGFSDQSYFTKQFGKFFEQSPSRYRATWGRR